MPPLGVEHARFLLSRPASFLPPDALLFLPARVGFPSGAGFEGVAQRLAGAKPIEGLRPFPAASHLQAGWPVTEDDHG